MAVGLGGSSQNGGANLRQPTQQQFYGHARHWCDRSARAHVAALQSADVVDTYGWVRLPFSLSLGKHAGAMIEPATHGREIGATWAARKR